MKKLLLAILLTVMGCGDGPSDDVPTCTDVDHPDCTAPADAGVGVLTEPIVIHGEYGATAAMGPCTHPFPGGVCYGANNRTFTVVFHAYSCAQTVGGASGAWWYQSIERGVKRGVSYLNDRSWNVTYVKQTAPGPSFGHVDVVCNYGSSGAIGTTIINESFPDHVFDCHDTQHGDFCQYSEATIVIRPDRAPTNPIWATATTSQRTNMVNNVGFHETMHFAGLPHRPHNPDAMNVMMPAIQAWLSPQWTSVMVPDVYQSLAIYCYVPTSSTTPIVGCPAP